MSDERCFTELLIAPADWLRTLPRRLAALPPEGGPRREALAARLGLEEDALLCALGFNRALRELPESPQVLAALGFGTFMDLARRRNRLFLEDVYQLLERDEVLAIYQAVREDPQTLELMQYLLPARLRRIEEVIERTVNSLVIERYKKEVRAIYVDGIASIEFAEARLARTDSGFRTLVNEVDFIVDSRLMPVGDIFFRDTVLAEEKRRLIARRLIPRELVIARLAEAGLSAQERRMLESQLALMP